MGLDDVRETPTHATRLGRLDVLEILFTGDQHRCHHDQQLGAELGLDIELEEIAEERNVGEIGHPPRGVLPTLLNQSAEDHRLTAVGADRRLRGCLVDRLNRHRLSVEDPDRLAGCGVVDL